MAEDLTRRSRERRVRDERSGKARRWGAVITGSSIAAYGLSRRSPAGIALAAAGGLLAYSGAQPNANRELIARSSLIINSPQEKVYQFWRNFENLPLFMRHLETVSVTGERRSRWIALGPMGTRVAWDAEIVNELPNEEIRWRSLPSSDTQVNGIVRFSRSTGDRGTQVQVVSIVEPPAGALGEAVAKIFGKDPSFMMRQDLRRLKALIETGEIPTIDGQSHGPRSLKIAAMRMLNPDQPVRARDANLKDVLTAQRRIA
jgi:uncharacterized membrane protein